jgi:multidrug resistance efflux pump
VKQRQASQQVEWEALQQTVANAKADLDKWTLESRASEIRTPLDQELIRLQMEEAGARYKQYQQDLISKKASMAAEIRILEITLIRQKRHLERHEIDLKKFTVRSPMDGLAVMASIWRSTDQAQIQEGDRVSPGQPFMKVVNQNSMQVEASMNQAEIGDFRVGLPAVIGLDAFPGLTFKGKIYSVGALANAGWRNSFYIRSVPVNLMIEGSDSRVIPDLSAFGDVEVEQKANEILAPLGAIRSVKDRTFVLVKGVEGFKERDVEVGTANNTHAVIVSGLKEGEEIRVD